MPNPISPKIPTPIVIGNTRSDATEEATNPPAIRDDSAIAVITKAEVITIPLNIPKKKKNNVIF